VTQDLKFSRWAINKHMRIPACPDSRDFSFW
jgi:hypothetical protein